MVDNSAMEIGDFAGFPLQSLALVSAFTNDWRGVSKGERVQGRSVFEECKEPAVHILVFPLRSSGQLLRAAHYEHLTRNHLE